MHKGHIATAKIAGTGSAINVSLGFAPDHIRIVNVTKLSEFEWFKEMAADSAVKHITDGTISLITSDGITPYAGASGSAGEGFTIGTDGRLNANEDVIYYYAFSADS